MGLVQGWGRWIRNDLSVTSFRQGSFRWFDDPGVWLHSRGRSCLRGRTCLLAKGRSTMIMSSPSTVGGRAGQALKQSAHPALRFLHVEESGEMIIITGRVSSYYLKQLAQETVMPVRGSLELVNRVHVVKQP